MRLRSPFLLYLLLTVGLVLTACGGDDAESSDGGTTIVTDQDGVVTDEDAADPDAADPDASAAEDDADGATSDTDGDTDGDDPAEPSADADADSDQASDPGTSGTGDGQITIDGETITFDTVERCEPFEAGDSQNGADQDGDSTLILVGIAPEGRFQVSFTETTGATANLTWNDGATDALYGGDFTRLPDETDWFFRDPNAPLDQVPVEVVNDRATGAGDLGAVGSDDQVSASFDLSIPAEFSC